MNWEVDFSLDPANLKIAAQVKTSLKWLKNIVLILVSSLNFWNSLFYNRKQSSRPINVRYKDKKNYLLNTPIFSSQP